jgi:hypothetical protein
MAPAAVQDSAKALCGRTNKSVTPILLGLAPHRLAGRVLHLEPIGRAARAVGRVPPLRDNVFEAHLAGMAEDDRAILVLDVLLTLAE